MFCDFDSEVTGSESRPEIRRVNNDRSCQTEDVKTSNQKTQTSCVESSSSQTSPQDNQAVVGDHTYDAEKLLKFLNRIMPHLKEELKNCEVNNDLSFAPDEFGNLNTDRQERLEQSFRPTELKPDFCKDKVVSSLSWNSSNMMLAIAYSDKSHNGWCHHESKIGLYNTDKLQFEKDPPTKLLNVFACVRCIQFHDHIPSLLAGALYNGDVAVWDLKHDEEVLMINKKGSGDEAAHVDVITFLTWREDENGLWLVTAGRDGRIILWRVTITNLSYEISQRFLILKHHLLVTAAPSEHLEILHMDFQSSKGPYFVVACDGGSLFYCSLTAARSLTSFPQYKDPVLHSYKQRKGILTHVSCSFDFFASSGTDSEIHIFRYEQESPVLKIHTNYAIFSVQWNSPKELVSWGDSIVECHKIDDPSSKNLICEVQGGISAVTFRLSSVWQTRKFAVGNQKGEILILKDWIYI